MPCETENGLQHHPARLILDLELEEQARLAGARLCHRGDDLAVTGLGLVGGGLHRIHLALAADELRKPTPGRSLQSGSQRSQPGHLIDVDRLADALDLGRSERLQREISFDQLARLLADCDRSGRRERLHPRGEIGGMADWSVLSLSAAGCYRPHDHLAGIHPDARFER